MVREWVDVFPKLSTSGNPRDFEATSQSADKSKLFVAYLRSYSRFAGNVSSSDGALQEKFIFLSLTLVIAKLLILLGFCPTKRLFLARGVPLMTPPPASAPFLITPLLLPQFPESEPLARGFILSIVFLFLFSPSFLTPPTQNLPSQSAVISDIVSSLVLSKR